MMELTGRVDVSCERRACVLFGRPAWRGVPWEDGLLAKLQAGVVHVRHAYSGPEVVRVVETETVDLALVADAPRLDGLSVLRMIRSLNGSLPCLLVANGPDRRWLEEALALRAESVFSPPIDVELMWRQVERILQARMTQPGGVS